ncbi:hypothetical protein AB4Y81_18110 [Paenarthrobacter sp. TAF1]|jgi:hypothetical protein|uniref:hypothetical protein n=1 Tax=Paenarthrobacter sp. TAF1 TaxID=3233067 RepID=UPI000368A5C1
MNEETHSDAANHHWYQCSSHRTSEGIIHYDSCPCGAQRIRLATETIHKTPPLLEPSVKQVAQVI